MKNIKNKPEILFVCLLMLIFMITGCGSARKDPMQGIEPIGGGCFGPRAETVKMVPLECARQGKVVPRDLQKCVLGNLGRRCAEYNVQKKSCIQACIEHVKRTKF